MIYKNYYFIFKMVRSECQEQFPLIKNKKIYLIQIVRTWVDLPTYTTLWYKPKKIIR